MKKIIARSLLLVAGTGVALWSCDNQNLSLSESTGTVLESVAVTSAQLASGTSFSVEGVSSSSTNAKQGKGPGGPGLRHGFPVDGLNLLTPTDELLAIVDAESAGDVRGLRISSKGGATITNYDAAGNVVSLPVPDVGKGPEGCSFSGKQFPRYDSLIAKIAKTVVDFGTGVTIKKDTITITRSGKIVITRSVSGNSMTEVTAYDGYSVNGISIEGTKTRVNTLAGSGNTGSSVTNVGSGKIIFADGTGATWTSTRTRTSDVTLSNRREAVSGTITTTGSTVVKDSNGDVIYSHVISTPIVENLACGKEHHGPVSGVVDTKYHSDTVSVDFGDGTCENDTITLTVNGVTTTKTIGA